MTVPRWPLLRDGLPAIRLLPRRRARSLVRVLSDKQADRVLDEKVRTLLHMGLSEFELRAKKGELPDTPAVEYLKFLTGVEEG